MLVVLNLFLNLHLARKNPLFINILATRFLLSLPGKMHKRRDEMTLRNHPSDVFFSPSHQFLVDKIFKKKL